MSVLTHFSPIRFQSKLPAETDVVIIGAGIIGVSTAWFLRQAGTRVLICEKGRVSGEQSGRNWGWVRQQGRDEAELPIMMESIALWKEFAAKFGPEIGFFQGGSLYLFENQAELDSYQDFLRIAENHRLDTRTIDREKLYRLVRHTPQQWKSALYTPTDARAEPSSAVTAIAGACAAAGVGIIENCGVDAIETTGNQVEGVYTEHGFVRCNRVLCSAGHWSANLLQSQGIALPQLSVKASVGRTAQAPIIFEGNASGSQIAFRRRQDGGYTVAMTDYLEVFPSLQATRQLWRFMPLMAKAKHKLRLRIYDQSAHVNPCTADADYRRLDANRVLNPAPGTGTLARLRARLDDRLPVMRDIPIVEAWSGMIDAMPDAVPVIDEIEQYRGLFVATGFSGHGFGIGPACGKIMARTIRGKTPGYDISRFRFSRFSDGSRLIPGPSI